MKRFFLVKDEDLPALEEDFGAFHFVHLASHGPAGEGWNLLVMCDEEYLPRASWLAFPSIYSARKTLADAGIPAELLADVGLSGEETCAEAAEKLGDIHLLMGI